LARKGDEHFVMAICALDASKAKMQIATAEQPAGHVTDDWTPGAVAIGVTLIIATLERGKIPLDRAVQR